MSVQNRKSLKNFFKKGELPSERHFDDLIDSMINKVDDGMSKTMEDGLMLSPIGTSQKLISFYKSIEEKNPAWTFDINSSDGTLKMNNHIGDSVMSIRQEGFVGINTDYPNHELEVQGTVASKGRLGIKYSGRFPADGKWHQVITELNGCHALEVIAGIGKKKTGRYALLHATALSTYGKSKNKIAKQQAYYGVKSNRIEIRWTGSTYNFNLEMRTKGNYEGDYFVKYFISDLWFDTFMDGSFDQSGDN